MGLEMCMWQMEISKMERLLTSEEACKEFLEAQFPDPDEEGEKGGEGRKAKYSVDPEDDGIDIGKSWHILHYLITGDEESGETPLAYAIMEGRPVVGLGGEFCWLAPEEVKDVADALDALSEEVLWKRSGKDSMSKVDIYKYPGEVIEDKLEDVLVDFNRLREYYKDAAVKGNAVLRLIS